MMNCPLNQYLVIMNVLLGKILSSYAERLNVTNFIVKSNIQHLLHWFNTQNWLLQISQFRKISSSFTCSSAKIYQLVINFELHHFHKLSCSFLPHEGVTVLMTACK